MSGADRATLALKVTVNLKPIHDMKTKSQAPTPGNPRIYVLQPFPPVVQFALPAPDFLAVPKDCLGLDGSVAPAALPLRQPLPTAVIDPAQPMLKLCLNFRLVV